MADKVLYFDPNETLITSNSNDVMSLNAQNTNNIFKNPEDYSIAVDLIVDYKNKKNVTNKNQRFSLISDKKTSGFISGSNVGGSKVLTDFFTNIDQSKDDVEVVDEAMCISSIDIEFNSWYAASVIINFVDVRGAALFSPYEHDGTSSESIFKSFFSFPYPMYTLKIKGHYGNSVSYPLHCSDFKAQFNSQTGNFEIVVHFIGYTYAMLNDIQIGYLMAAPYVDSELSTGDAGSYWNSQVQNGRFRTSDSQPLPTMLSLMQKCKEASFTETKLNATDPSVIALKETEVKLSSLKSIDDDMKAYLVQINKSYGGIFKENNLYYSDKLKLYNPQNELLEYLKKSKISLEVKIKSYTTKYGKDVVFSTFEENKSLIPTLVNGIYVIDLTEIGKNITQSISDNNINKNIVTNKFNTTKIKSIDSILGLRPTMFNYIKILIAHMETMYYHINKCAVEINNINRKFKDVGINLSDTDVRGSSTDSGNEILPPFPWYSKDNTDAYIGTVNQNLQEVDLVRKFQNAINDVNKKIKEINAFTPKEEPKTLPNSGNVILTALTDKRWYPINAFDNPFSGFGDKRDSPYADIAKMEPGVAKNELFTRLGVRISTIMNLSSDSKLDDYFALAESENIMSDLNSTYVELAKNAITHMKNINEQTNSYDVLHLNDTRKGYYDYNQNGLFSDKVIPLFDVKSSVYTTYFKTDSSVPSYNNLHFSKGEYVNENNVTVSYPGETTFKIIEGSENCITVKKFYDEIINKTKTSKNDKINFSFEKNKFYEISNYYLESNLYKDQPLLNKITYKKIKCSPNSTTNVCSINNYNESTELLANNGTQITSGDGGVMLRKTDLYLIYGVDNKSLSTKKMVGDMISKKIDISNLTYPMIGGKINIEKSSGDGNIFSCLFGHSIYYSQNNKQYGNSDDINKSNKRKACLFLSTLDIDQNLVESLINQNITVSPKDSNRLSYILRLPKSSILLIGSILWRHKNNIKYNHSISINDNIEYLTPTSDTYFKNSKNQFILTPKEKYDFIESNLFYGIEKNKIGKSIFTNNEENELIKYFEDWCVIGSTVADSWEIIKNTFEITDKNNHALTQETFNEICVGFKQSRTLGVGAKFLEDNLNKKIIKSYVRFDTNETNIKASGEVNNSLLLLNRDDTAGVKAILTLLTTECILAYVGKGDKTKTLETNRVSGFIDKLYSNLKISITKNQSTTITNTKYSTSKTESSMTKSEDLELSMYSYLKTLHDKWVSGFEGDEESFKWITKDKPLNNQMNSLNTVIDPYYIKNFRFIDRAHNDIGNSVYVNYKDLYESLNNSTPDKTLFSTVTDVLAKNQFLFLPMPSYQSFQTKEELGKIFEPVPYGESNMSANDHGAETSLFICMYSGRPSSRLDNGINKNDSYPMNPDKNHDLPKDMFILPENPVPAIGISYGKQNQSYFKNMSLNMSNPNTTEASINVLQQLNERANQNSTLQPIGQDLYNLYSQYAYTCDIEMAGCAQIQPMMYFDLNCVPMWNGAYMIFKIKHSIIPGVMTTKFSGMRMAKTYPKLLSETSLSFNVSGTLGSLDLGAPLKETKDSTPINVIDETKKFRDGDHFHIVDYFRDENGLGKPLFTEIPTNIYNRLEFLSLHVELIYSKWKTEMGGGDFRINSGYRHKDPVDVHDQGLAADLQLINNPNEVNTKRLFDTVLNIMNDGINIDQVILEKQSNYLVHIGLGHTNKTTITIVKGGRYESRGQFFTRDNNTKPPTDGIINSIDSSKWPDVIGISTIPLDPTLTTTEYNNRKDVFTQLKTKGLTKEQVAGIMGNIQQESRFELDLQNLKGISTGLIHWSKGGGYGNTIDIIKSHIGSSVFSQITFLTDGHTTNYSKWKTKSANYNTPEECAESFCLIVEVAGKAKIETRKGYARAIYNHMNIPGDPIYWY